MRFLLALVVGLFAVACVSAAEHTARPRVQMVVVDDSLQTFAPLWQVEIDRRFPNAVAILCHGGEVTEGEWVVKAPFGNKQITKAADLVKHYQALYPKRTIVLLACNPGHLKLGVPGVYYANSSVWCVPDRDVMSHARMQYFKTDGAGSAKAFDGDDRSRSDPEVVGSIWEFEAE